jgi:hypothetical protein
VQHAMPQSITAPDGNALRQQASRCLHVSAHLPIQRIHQRLVLAKHLHFGFYQHSDLVHRVQQRQRQAVPRLWFPVTWGYHPRATSPAGAAAVLQQRQAFLVKRCKEQAGH